MRLPGLSGLSVFRVRFPLLLASLALACSAQASLIAGSSDNVGPGLGGTAINNFVVNPDGIGHHLIVPFFSVQNGGATILNLVNTDPVNAKAVKVRFRGATNADSVFSLTVFLSPGDVWNAAVTRNADSGLAQLVSGDDSCTLPVVNKGVPASFTTVRLNPALSTADQAGQTREGYVEILTMADIPSSSVTTSLFQAVSQQTGGARNCAAAAIAATQKDATTEGQATALGFASPVGSLRATWTLINVPQTLTFSGAATALLGVDKVTNVPGRGNFMFFPQSDSLTGNADGFTADPLLRQVPAASKTYDGRTGTYVSASLPLVKPTFADFPDLSTPLLSGLADPMAQASLISKVLAVKSVRNDYATDLTVNAATDWVFTRPTLRFSVAMDYIQSRRVYSLMPGNDNLEFFSDENISLKDGKVCTDNSFVFYDREEASRTNGADTQLSSAFSVKLCGAAAALLFGTAPVSAVGASVTAELTGTRAFANGWGRIDLNNRYTGVPVLGGAFVKASNPSAAAGVSGNYGITTVHKFSR